MKHDVWIQSAEQAGTTVPDMLAAFKKVADDSTARMDDDIEAATIRIFLIMETAARDAFGQFHQVGVTAV